VAQVERQYPSAVTFRTSDHGGIGKAEWKISVATRERTNARHIMFSTVNALRAASAIRKKNVKNTETVSRFHYVRQFAQHSRRNAIRPDVVLSCGRYLNVGAIIRV